jgi:hypothetical protein
MPVTVRSRHVLASARIFAAARVFAAARIFAAARVFAAAPFFAVAWIALLSAAGVHDVAAAADGTLSFAASSYTGAQNGGSVIVTVTRTGGAADAASVAYDTSGNTALLGVNYVHTAGRLHWASGDSSPKTITIPLINGTPYSGTKSFYITLSDADGASVASPSIATLTISGDGPAGVLSLASTTYSAAENAGSVTLSVTRTSGSAGAASIAYDTSANTAKLGVDYEHTGGRLSWASGDSSTKTITVPLIKGAAYSGTRSFYLTVYDPYVALLGSPTKATITITGDGGSGSGGSVDLASSAVTVLQSAGSVHVSVNRTGGSSGAASVGYGTANSTAISGKDYTAESGVLTWASGDTTAKSFSVPISNSTPFTGSKAFAIALSSASGATLGSPSAGVVTITGDGASTGTATLSWAAPTTNTNGTPLTDLSGYYINYGTSASALTNEIKITSATTTSYEITNLATGTWYFTVNAYTSDGVESAASGIAEKTI